MHFHERHVTPFDMKIDNNGYEFDLEVELIEMHVDLEANALSKGKKPRRILKQYQYCY